MNGASEPRSMKASAMLKDGRAAGFRAYRALCYGRTGLGHVLRAELTVTLAGALPGAAGLFLRRHLYRGLFAAAGGGLIIGRNVAFRHFRRIRLGQNVVIDDNCLVDAKGTEGSGITVGDHVFVGRGTIVYTKNGDITIEPQANISSSCTLFSSNSLAIGKGTMIGAYTYLLSGGEYDYRDPTPFAQQSGTRTRGPLRIGDNCWIGARVTVLDGAAIGDHCVVGAGAVVTGPIPADSLAVGCPARVVRSIASA
jgi:acetyltransferase-like isoleucine patch superfamily enzyme